MPAPSPAVAMRTYFAQFDERAAELGAAALLDAYTARHDGTGVKLDAAMLVTTALA